MGFIKDMIKEFSIMDKETEIISIDEAFENKQSEFFLRLEKDFIKERESIFRRCCNE